jgi:integrase
MNKGVVNVKSNEIIQEKFLVQLNRKGLSKRRIDKYIILLRKINKSYDLNNLSHVEIDQFFFFLKGSQDLASDTKLDYWNMFRIFVKWMNPKIDLSEYKLQCKKKRKFPEEILEIDEVKKIILSAKSIRDRAILSLLYDLGCRPGELLNLKIKDLTFNKNGLTVSLDGKTGMRRIPVITTLNSVRFLKEWLLIHENEKDPESFLFYSNNNKNKYFSITRFNQIVQEYAKTVGITKHVNSYIFRHSRATHLAQHLTEAQMKIYLGWTMDSKMAGTYVHLCGRDLEEKVLELNGENVSSDTTTTSTGLQGNLIQAVLALSQEVNDLKKQMLSMNREPVKVEA